MGSQAHFLKPLVDRPDDFGLYVSDRPDPIASVVERAFDSTTRNRGLLGRNALAEGSALVIAPCSAVHTFGMRFPIDVIFASAEGRVVKMRQAMVPARVTGAMGAFATIEMAAGSVARTGLKVGDVLIVRASVSVTQS